MALSNPNLAAPIAADPGFARRVKEGASVQELVQYVAEANIVGRPVGDTCIRSARAMALSGSPLPSQPAPHAQSASAAQAGGPELSDSERLKALLKGKKKAKARFTVEQIADALDMSPRRVREALTELGDQHYLIHEEAGTVGLREAPEPGRKSTLNTESFFGKKIRFGVCGDNHLCSKYAREEVLQALYDIYEREGIQTVYNTGNWIDGERRFNKTDIFIHGMGNQVKYFADNYPKRDGISTYFVAGDDHEGWYNQDMCMDIGKYAEMIARDQGREDLVYLGYMEHDIVLEAEEGSATLRVMHPGGGSAYAISYTSQKMIESLTGGEKPNVILAGHYHKAEYLYYRNVHLIQTATTMDQSPFMRKKRLSAHVGGWIVEMNQAPDGSINRFKSELITFYDKDWYKGKWRYEM